jgi:hypothetical protein
VQEAKEVSREDLETVVFQENRGELEIRESAENQA